MNYTDVGGCRDGRAALDAPKFLAEAAEAAKKIDTLSTTRQMHNDDGFVLKDGEEAPFDFELVD